MANAPTPPQNLEAEENVLGAIMLSPNAVDLAAEEVTPDDFYRPKHGKIFDAALRLHANDQPVDAITLADELARCGALKEVGGKERLHELASLVPVWKNVAHYARMVREQAVLRALIDSGQEITKLGQIADAPAADQLERAQQIVFDLTRDRSRSDLVPAGAAAREAYQHLLDLHDSGRDVIGLRCGYHHIDLMTSGLQNGNLIIVAGRPSMGKSALGAGVISHVVLYEQLPVALFTLEMSTSEVMQRLIAIEGSLDLHSLRTGKLDSEGWQRATNAVGKLEAAPLYIDDNGAMTLIEIRARARQLKLKQPDLALIVVDYIQMLGSGTNHDNRVQEVSQISRGLKVLARELDVPVLALSQLSRGPEQRHDKRPLMSDLRESGSIEQDADVVMFCYREEYYNPDDVEVAGLAEIIIAKHRNGPTGTAKLTFVKRQARFSDPALLGVVG